MKVAGSTIVLEAVRNPIKLALSGKKFASLKPEQIEAISLEEQPGHTRVLLDTAFILPTLGIDVGPEVLKGLKQLVNIKAEIYYSRFSLRESLWVTTRLSRSSSFDADRFQLGLRSILKSGEFKEMAEETETFTKALQLHTLGHNDLIDNLLYASATSGLVLVPLPNIEDWQAGFTTLS